MKFEDYKELRVLRNSIKYYTTHYPEYDQDSLEVIAIYLAARGCLANFLYRYQETYRIMNNVPSEQRSIFPFILSCENGTSEEEETAKWLEWLEALLVDTINSYQKREPIKDLLFNTVLYFHKT